MADPYSGVSISNYNSNPPADDGSQVEANRVKWSTIKTKITDPVKVRTDDMNTELIAAFAKMLGGAGLTSTAINYQVISTDQGKLVRATSSGITITTPDATDVEAPFVFAYLNDSTGDTTLDGSGSQTIDGDTTVTIPAGCGVMLWTDGSNWYTTGQNFQRTQVFPQGYLTPTSLTPIIASDSTAATAVYYTPFVGNLVPVPNGTLFAVREFAELTLTLNANHSANAIYDVFIFDDAGTIRIGTGPAWSSATAGSSTRGTGAGTTELELLKGLYVNKVAATLRNGATTYSVSAKCAVYVGSLLMDGSAGQVTCHRTAGQTRKWGIWNAFNRQMIHVSVTDSTSNWTYSTDTWRVSENDTANVARVFTGLAEENFAAIFTQRIECAYASNDATGRIGIGWNSSTAPSGKNGVVVGSNTTTTGTVVADAVAVYDAPPHLGLVNCNCLERAFHGGGAASVTFVGVDSMRLSIKYQG